MYAIVNIAGQQYKVEKDQRIFVHRLDGKEGESINFDEVLLIDNEKNIMVGEPTVKGARIVGKIISHPKSDRVQVFKKKRRKGYQVLNGHRQYMTELQIQDIIEKGADKAAGTRTETTAVEKPSTSKEEVPVKKTSAAKKTTETPKKTTALKTGSTAGKPATKKASDTRTASKPAAKTPAASKPAAKKSNSGSASNKE